MRVNLKQQLLSLSLFLPELEIGVTWSGFDPQLTPMKATRATAAAAAGCLLAAFAAAATGCLACCKLLLLATARSHNFRPGCTLCHHLAHHLLPSSFTTIRLFPSTFTFPSSLCHSEKTQMSPLLPGWEQNTFVAVGGPLYLAAR